MSLFGENIEDDAVKFNNFRVSFQSFWNVQKIIFLDQVYGTAMLIFMSLIVFLGVQIVNKVSKFVPLFCVICSAQYDLYISHLSLQFASVALVCVIGSIISIYTGVFVNVNGNDASKYYYDANDDFDHNNFR